MRRLELSLDLLTGVDEIDGQHEKLFALGNSVLFPPSGTELSNLEFADAVTFLRQYVVSHFEAEQRAMEASDYPRLRHHLAAHQRFRDELRRAIEASRRGRGTVGQLKGRIHVLLSDWFAEHIRHEDTALARYLIDPDRPETSARDAPGEPTASDAETRSGRVAADLLAKLQIEGITDEDLDQIEIVKPVVSERARKRRRF